MTVISLNLSESTEQIVSGIPKTLTVTASVPSTIFYTVDGSLPTTDSNVYIGPISLPTNNSSVNFQTFATDGVVSSSVLQKIYSPNLIGARLPHATVIGLNTQGPNQIDSFPFSDFSPDNPLPYGKSGGITVDDPSIINIPDGYDGAGNIANGTDLPLTSYKRIFSTTNSEGETGPGIGTLPAKVTIKVPIPVNPSSSSDTSSKFFNPKAMVIYQDSSKPSYDNVSQLNRASFSLVNTEREKNGAYLMNNAFDSSTISGSFLRSYFNPKDNTINYYYRDAFTNQWIISKEHFIPRNPDLGALYKVVFSSRGNGNIGQVFKWLPFASRKLI